MKPTQDKQATDRIPYLLLVEDHPVALLMLENIVTQALCQFISTIDGETAFDLASNQSFDLIITDLGLPGMSGLDLTKKLRTLEKNQKKTETPIVGLSAHANIQIKEECMKLGMNELLTKPMTADVFENIKTTYLSTQSTTKAPPPTKLGLDLPDTEDELFKLDVFPILDINSALIGIGHDTTLLKTILTSMLEQVLPKDMLEIAEAHAKQDWLNVESIAHRMKGGLVYCGTTKLVHACQYLERYRKAGYVNLLEPLYQQMLAVSDETIPEIKAWLSR